MPTVEEVTIEVRSDTSNIKKGFDKADKRISKTGKLLRRLGGALAAFLTVRTIARWAQDTAAWANELDKVAREMGITVRAAQQLDFISKATGISMANIRDAAFEIKKRFGEIGENERFRNTMKALNVSKEQAAGLNNAQLMFQVLEKISRLPLEEQEIALDQAFGGGAAKELNQLVKDRQFFLDVLEKSGGLKGIEGGAEAAKKMRLEAEFMRARFQEVSATLLNRILPHIIRMFEWLEENSEEIKTFAKAAFEVGKFIAEWGFALSGLNVIAKASDAISKALFSNWEMISEKAENFKMFLEDAWLIIQKIWDVISNPTQAFERVREGIKDGIGGILESVLGQNPFANAQTTTPAPGTSPPPPPQFFNSGQGPLQQTPAPILQQTVNINGGTADQAFAKVRREQQRAFRDLRTD